MIKMKSIIIASTLLPCSLFAQQGNSCLQDAFTQSEMTRCEGMNFATADAELNRVYSLIRKIYKDDDEFISKLKSSQLAWIKLRDADLEMMYPLEDKQLQYGSAYPMCASGFVTTLTLQRVEYLKKWLVGIGEGDVCSGSIKRPFQIEELIK